MTLITWISTHISFAAVPVTLGGIKKEKQQQPFIIPPSNISRMTRTSVQETTVNYYKCFVSGVELTPRKGRKCA
jgi:hypothetical protein